MLLSDLLFLTVQELVRLENFYPKLLREEQIFIACCPCSVSLLSEQYGEDQRRSRESTRGTLDLRFLALQCISRLNCACIELYFGIPLLGFYRLWFYFFYLSSSRAHAHSDLYIGSLLTGK